MYSEVQVISNHSTIQIVDNSEVKTLFYNQNKLKYIEKDYQNYENLSKNEEIKIIEKKMKNISNQVKLELKKLKNENVEIMKNNIESSSSFQELKDENRLPSIQYFFNNEGQSNEENYKIDEMQQVKNLKMEKNEKKIVENFENKLMNDKLDKINQKEDSKNCYKKSFLNDLNEKNFLSNKNSFLTNNLNYTENQFFETNFQNKNELNKNISINCNPILNNYLSSYSKKVPIKLKYNENINSTNDYNSIYDSSLNNNILFNDQSVNKKISHKNHNMNTTNSILTTGSTHFDNQTSWNSYLNNSMPYFYPNNQIDQFIKQKNDIPVNLWLDQDQKVNRRKYKKISKKFQKNSFDNNEKINDSNLSKTNQKEIKIIPTEIISYEDTYNNNIKSYSTDNEIIPYELLKEFETNTQNQIDDNSNKKRPIDDDYNYKNYKFKTNYNGYENFDKLGYKSTLENNQFPYYQNNLNKLNFTNYDTNEEFKKTYNSVNPINYSMNNSKEKNLPYYNNYDSLDKNDFKNTHSNLTNNSYSFFQDKSFEKINETKKTKIIYNEQKEFDNKNYTKKNFIKLNCHTTKNKWKKFSKNNLSADDLERKRNLANTQERKRMLTLNTALDNLRQLIQNRFFRLDITQDHDTFNPNTPSSISSDHSSNCKTKKLSKIMTLRMAIDYISHLNSLLNENSNL